MRRERILPAQARSLDQYMFRALPRDYRSSHGNFVVPLPVTRAALRSRGPFNPPASYVNRRSFIYPRA